MNDETRERFIKAILERIPVERIVELHLFPPIRQGQVETGVAVVAATAGAHVPRLTSSDSRPSTHDSRLVVLTARYRLTRKGPDRGMWEIDVTPQADAPLETVDTVVRGAQQRAGEGIEALRLTAHDLRALMSEPAWQINP